MTGPQRRKQEAEHVNKKCGPWARSWEALVPPLSCPSISWGGCENHFKMGVTNWLYKDEISLCLAVGRYFMAILRISPADK